MFIKLTSKDGRSISVNVRNMSMAEIRDSETVMAFPTGGHFETMYVFVKEHPETIFERAMAAGILEPLRLVRGRAGNLVVNLNMVSIIEPLGSGTQLTVPTAGGGMYSKIQIANTPESLIAGNSGPCEAYFFD